MKYSLGIDVGTSALKAALFDENGLVAAQASKEYDIISLCDGYAEQNPQTWWEACCAAVSAAIEKSAIKASDICAVGLSGQMHGLVMTDADGAVLRNAILWCDLRTQKQCDEIEETIGRSELIKITANRAAVGFTASKILWVRETEKEIYDRCCHILLPKDYIRYRLTGEFASDVSDASGTGLLDVARRTWSEDITEKLGIDKRLLPRLYESVEVTGRVSSEASRLTGLCEGCAVVGGGGDNACSAIGTAVCSDGSAFTTIGTSGVVFAHTSKLHTDSQGRIHAFCAAVPDEWHVMGVTQAAGLSLKWFCENFCEAEKQKALAQNCDVYAVTDAAAAASAIGSGGVIYLPYLNGERTPHFDANVRGAFLNLSANNTRGDLIRAVMEGVTFSLRDCVEMLRHSGANISDMAICGGGAKSALWREMIADNFNMPIKRMSSSEGGALGAAILAFCGAKVYKSVAEGAERAIRVRDVTEPRNAHEYDAYYEKYRAGYARVK